MSLGSLFSEKETAAGSLRERGDGGGSKEEWRERKLWQRCIEKGKEIFSVKEKILEEERKISYF